MATVTHVWPDDADPRRCQRPHPDVDTLGHRVVGLSPAQHGHWPYDASHGRHRRHHPRWLAIDGVPYDIGSYQLPGPRPEEPETTYYSAQGHTPAPSVRTVRLAMRLPRLTRRSEHRAASSDPLVQLLLQQAGRGRVGGIASPEGSGAAEACAGLVGRSFAGALTTPTDVGLTPSIMSTLGRELILRGQLVCWIRVDRRGGLALREVADHQIVSGGTDPSTWRYRLQVPTPTGRHLSQEVMAEEVCHWRVNASASEPWRGRSPLSLAVETAELAATLEQRTRQEVAGPVGQLLPLPTEIGRAGMETDSVAMLETQLAGLGGHLALVEGMTGGFGEPSRRDQTRGWSTMRLGGSIPQTHQLLLTDASIAVMSACGVPPTLLNPAGADTREAWRRFASGTMEPLGRIMLQEARSKLDTAAEIDWSPLHASDIAGRARAFHGLVTGGMDIERAARLSGLLDGD